MKLNNKPKMIPTIIIVAIIIACSGQLGTCAGAAGGKKIKIRLSPMSSDGRSSNGRSNVFRLDSDDVLGLFDAGFGGGTDGPGGLTGIDYISLEIPDLTADGDLSLTSINFSSSNNGFVPSTNGDATDDTTASDNSITMRSDMGDFSDLVVAATVSENFWSGTEDIITNDRALPGTATLLTSSTHAGYVYGSISSPANAMSYRIETRPSPTGSGIVYDLVATRGGRSSERIEGIVAAQNATIVDTNFTRAGGREKEVDCDDDNVIDLMVVYTVRAMCNEAGMKYPCIQSSGMDMKELSAAIETSIELEVAEANMAFSNSGALARLRLVHAYADRSYEENRDSPNMWEQVIYQLRNTNDGVLDSVLSTREEYGADLVTLVVAEGYGKCGLAFQDASSIREASSWGYTVIHRECINGMYTLAHEIGHNLGCNHDRRTDDATNSKDYAFGYNDPSGRFHTIMAYPRGSDWYHMIPYFSTPKDIYRYRIGNPGENNVKKINENYSKVANFYKCTVPNSRKAPVKKPKRVDLNNLFRVEKTIRTRDDNDGWVIESEGVMFDIRARRTAEQGVLVNGFELNLGIKPGYYEEYSVYTRAGGHLYFTDMDSRWIHLGTYKVGYAASLKLKRSVHIHPGRLQAFAIFCLNKPNIQSYNRRGAGTDKVEVGDKNLALMVGTVKKGEAGWECCYDFEQTNRYEVAFSGSVNYSLLYKNHPKQCPDDSNFRYSQVMKNTCKRFAKNSERCNTWDKFGRLVKNHCSKSCNFCSRKQCKDFSKHVIVYKSAEVKRGVRIVKRQVPTKTTCAYQERKGCVGKDTRGRLIKEICRKSCKLCG